MLAASNGRLASYAERVTALPASPTAHQARSRRTKQVLLDAGFQLLEEARARSADHRGGQRPRRRCPGHRVPPLR